MAIAFDIASNGGYNGGLTTSLSWSHTCSGEDRALVVGVAASTASDVVTGVTYNGVALTLVTKLAPSGRRWSYLYLLLAPPSGTYTVVVTASATSDLFGGAASYTGVKQTDNPHVFTTNVGATAATSTSVTTTLDGCWGVLLENGYEGGNSPISGGSGTVRRVNDVTTGNWGLFDEQQATAGSLTLTTVRASVGGNHILLALCPTVVGGTITRSATGVVHGYANSTSLSFSYTCTGSNRFLAVALKLYGTDDVTSVTYNGVPVVHISDGEWLLDSGVTRLKVYGLTGPASGANTIQVTRSGANHIVASAVAYEGVAQSGQPTAFAVDGFNGAATEPPVTVATAGSWIVGAGIGQGDGGTFVDGEHGLFLGENTLVVAGILGLFDSESGLNPGTRLITIRKTPGAAIIDGVVFVLAPASGTTATDDFNRADGALGANWTVTGAGAPTIAGAQAQSFMGGGLSAAFYSGVSFAGDHESQATRANGADYSAVGVRLSTAGGGAGYAYFSHGSIQKIVAGTNSEIVATTPFASGAVVRLRVTGSLLEWWVNGVSQGTVTDTAIGSGGAPGIVFASPAGARLDDWSGTDEFSALVTVTDDFNRADSSSLGANWTQLGESSFRITSNAANAVSVNEAHIAAYTGTAVGNDQFAEVTLGTGFIQYSGPIVRASGAFAVHNSYYCLFSIGNPGSIGKKVGGTPTTLATFPSTFANPGDVIRLEILGDRLRCFINGVQVGSDIFDSSITAGAPGINCYAASVVHGEIDSFTAGDLVPPTLPLTRAVAETVTVADSQTISLSYAEITLVASVSTAGGENGGSTAAIDTTGATLLVVSVAWYNPGSGVTVSDAKGNTWTPLTLSYQGSLSERLFYCLTPTVGTGHTFTVSGTGIYAPLLAYAFAGVASYQTESGSNGTVASLACGSVTPSADGALILTGRVGFDTGTVAVTPPGFTVVTHPYSAGVNVQGSAAWYVQPTAAAINPTWEVSGASDAAVRAVVFLPAAASPPETTTTTVSRTWFNTLVDDSGDLTSGTIVDVAFVDAIYDDIDALFVGDLDIGGVLTAPGGLGTTPLDGAQIADASVPISKLADADAVLRAGVTAVFDGGGSVLTAKTVYVQVPFAGTVTGWRIVADVAGNAVVDVWRAAYADYPPTVANTIAGTEKPTLAAVVKAEDLTLTTWDTALAAGDFLAFALTGPATCTWLSVQLIVEKGA